jgi:hypothetical protein
LIHFLALVPIGAAAAADTSSSLSLLLTNHRQRPLCYRQHSWYLRPRHHQLQGFQALGCNVHKRHTPTHPQVLPPQKQRTPLQPPLLPMRKMKGIVE